MEKYSTLEKMYWGMYKLVYTYISDYTKDITVAGDIASIIWGKVVENPSKFLAMEICHLRNYMRKMVKTAVSDYFRTEERQDELLMLEKILEAEKSVEEQYICKEDLIYLDRARKVLNEDERQLVYLRFGAELSAREVGEAFGISEGAVRVKQYRILKKLKAEIIRLQQQMGRKPYEKNMDRKVFF